MYQVDGWEGLVPKADLQGYLDTAQLYEDNWVTVVPDPNAVGWQLLKDVLKPIPIDYPAGTRVQGLYGDGTWYDGVVHGKNPTGAYLLTFDLFAGSPPEPVSEVRVPDHQAQAPTPTQDAAAAVAPLAPVAPVAPTAPVAPLAPLPTATTKEWHVLASDGVNTNGPFSVEDLTLQLRDGVVLSSTAMIHDTGAEWVTVGTVATAPSGGGGGGVSAKDYAASQTRRKKSVCTVFSGFSSAPEKKRAPSVAKATGSRNAPIKSGTKKYRNNANSYDEVGAMVICQWMEMILRREISGDAAGFMQVLQSETHIFAELFNEFKPNSTRKVKKSKMRFKQLENVQSFFMACKGMLDMQDIQLFSANDLLDGKHLDKVLTTIVEFAKRMVKSFPEGDRPPELVVSLKR